MTHASVALELLPVQYGDAAGVVTSDEADAQTATYFTPDGEVYAALKRSVRGKWMFDISDFFPGEGPIWRTRWATAAEALVWLAARDGNRTVAEVTL